MLPLNIEAFFISEDIRYKTINLHPFDESFEIQHNSFTTLFNKTNTEQVSLDSTSY